MWSYMVTVCGQLTISKAVQAQSASVTCGRGEENG